MPCRHLRGPVCLRPPTCSSCLRATTNIYMLRSTPYVAAILKQTPKFLHMARTADMKVRGETRRSILRIAHGRHCAKGLPIPPVHNLSNDPSCFMPGDSELAASLLHLHSKNIGKRVYIRKGLQMRRVGMSKAPRSTVAEDCLRDAPPPEPPAPVASSSPPSPFGPVSPRPLSSDSPPSSAVTHAARRKGNPRVGCALCCNQRRYNTLAACYCTKTWPGVDKYCRSIRI